MCHNTAHSTWLQKALLPDEATCCVPSAAALAAWDRHILSNRHALFATEEELQRVSAGQQVLERKIGMIETHQMVRQ